MNIKAPFTALALLVSITFLAGCGVTVPETETVPSATATQEAPAATPDVTDEPTVEPTATPTPVEVEPEDAPDGKNSTVALLRGLKVTEDAPAGYKRELFPHWSTGSNGCTTRENVLAREVVDGVVNGCSITGTWVSIYDNKTTTDPGVFDIDHMVPLKEAWVSGAYAWDTATREAYANDMEGAYSLIAVTAGSNRSKGERDPASWMPDTMDGCEYVARWVSVKHRWNLTVDKAEKDKIRSVLAWCGGDYTLPEKPEKASVTVDTTPVTSEEEEPAVKPSDGDTDPQFGTCKEATSNGFGPYVKGQDAEYEWYRDGDGDGTVCE